MISRLTCAQKRQLGRQSARRHCEMLRAPANWLGGMYGEFLYDRIRQQLCGKLGDPILRDRLGELDLEALALAHPGDLAEAEAPAGAGDRLALRVMDLGFQHDVDDESRHIPNSTRAGSPNAGRDPARLAVALT